MNQTITFDALLKPDQTEIPSIIAKTPDQAHYLLMASKHFTELEPGNLKITVQIDYEK